MFKFKKTFLILLLVLLATTAMFLVCPKYINIFRQELTENTAMPERDELVVYNFKSGKYHDPNCKYAKSCTKSCKTIKRSELPKDTKYCGYCRKHHPLKEAEPEKQKIEENKIKKVSDFKNEAPKPSPKPESKKEESKTKIIPDYKANGEENESEPDFPKPKNAVIEPAVPDVSTKFIDLYFIDPTKYDKPASYCRTSACQALLREINNAKESIDFAIYGIGGQPEIFNALLNAQKRGVNVRGVVDMNINYKNPYNKTHDFINELKTVKTDYLTDKKIAESNNTEAVSYPKGARDYPKVMHNNKMYIPDGIMHNKFFIFDNQKVWTGSTNISSTCIGGYNANEASLTKSSELAMVYKQEFEQMYAGNFHNFKRKICKRGIKLPDGTVLSAYFSPTNNTITTVLVPLVKSAHRNIDIAAFFLTNRDLTESLIEAHDRGVDVRIITDATAAKTSPMGIIMLRDAGIPVKIENFGGKMHMKVIMIDDKYLVTGSMNLTKSANSIHDENTLIIENARDALAFKSYFEKIWLKIPDKWLYEKPKAESIDSIGSCSDGVDNDHDGHVDMDDYDCNPALKMAK